jgi:hypothetical protein
MEIHFQLTAMAPKGSHNGMGEATARALMLTSGINQCLTLDRNHVKGFVSEHISGLIQIDNVCGVQDARAYEFI